MLIFFHSLFLLIFFEVKCVVDRYKWHRPFQMATTVLRNGNDRFKGQRPLITKGKFAAATATRTSYQNINSRYCNHVVTVSTFFVWQGCGIPSKMTPVGTALNFGEKMKIYPRVLTFFIMAIANSGSCFAKDFFLYGAPTWLL